MIDTFPCSLTRKHNLYCLRLPTGTGFDCTKVFFWGGKRSANENIALGLEDGHNAFAYLINTLYASVYQHGS